MPDGVAGQIDQQQAAVAPVVVNAERLEQRVALGKERAARRKGGAVDRYSFWLEKSPGRSGGRKPVVRRLNGLSERSLPSASPSHTNCDWG